MSRIIAVAHRLFGLSASVGSPIASDTPTNGILLENGTDFLLMESGDFVLQES